LTTGKPGHLALLYPTNWTRPQLVLAKNGNVGPADYIATHTFISDLKAATDRIDLLPFLANHSKANMDERINNLHQSIADLSSDLQLAAAEYSYESMENEFPG
jgi:hypothetical protein